MTFKPRATRFRVIVAAVLFVLGAGGTFVYDELTVPDNPKPSISARPLPEAAAPEPLTPSDIQHVRDVLGPFQTILVAGDTPTPETHSPAVLILNEDGSTEASTQWTVGYDSNSWVDEDVFEIRSLSVNLGYVTVGANNDRTYVVKVMQPFIFATEPNRVVVIDAQGQVHVLTTARAEASRRSI